MSPLALWSTKPRAVPLPLVFLSRPENTATGAAGVGVGVGVGVGLTGVTKSCEPPAHVPVTTQSAARPVVCVFIVCCEVIELGVNCGANCSPVLWFWTACSMLCGILPERLCGNPLPTTAASVGMTCAPPV